MSTDTGDIRQIIHNGMNGIVVKNTMDFALLARSAVDALVSIKETGVEMDNVYRLYEKERAMNELEQVLNTIAQHD